MTRAGMTRTIRDLAKQDTAGNVDDSFARTGDALDTIRRWRQAAREGGDVALVKTIDALGEDRAAEIYARARFDDAGHPMSSHSRAAEPPHPTSGFGKEKTVADIRRRIAWETWAEAHADASLRAGHRKARIGYEWLLDQQPAVIRARGAKARKSHGLAAGRAKKGKYRIEGYDGDYRTRDMLAQYSDGHRIHSLVKMTEAEVLAEASRWMETHPPPQDTYGKRPYVMISDMGRGGPYTIAVFEAKGRAWVRAR